MKHETGFEKAHGNDPNRRENRKNHERKRKENTDQPWGARGYSFATMEKDQKSTHNEAGHTAERAGDRKPRDIKMRLANRPSHGRQPQRSQ